MKPYELTVGQLASFLGESEGRLWSLSENPKPMFHPTRRELVGVKERDIDTPKAWSKKLLRRLHRFIQRNFTFPGSVHGGIRKRSCFTSAEEHLGRSYVVSRDITAAYPSIQTEPLRQALRRYGFRSDVTRLLSGIMTVHGRIPQGSPTSSDALNLFMVKADKAILRKCSTHHGVRFTRVYDDFIISTNSRPAAEALGQTIEDQAEKLGLVINEKKKLKSGLQRRSAVQRVHNIAVNSPRGTKIVVDQKDRALEIATSYVRAARCVTPDSFLALVKKRERLHGWIHHTAQATFGPASQLKRQLSVGDRLVRERLRPLAIIPKEGRWWVRSKRTTPERIVHDWTKRAARDAP